MTAYENALKTIKAQTRSIKKIDGVRFVHNGYEYRLIYFGGFAAHVGIDRRQVGKRNFKYFGGIAAYRCSTVEQVLDLVMQEVEKKAR